MSEITTPSSGVMVTSFEVRVTLRDEPSNVFPGE